jgi:glycosyltransferase involved in cell wall biosynthesis
MLGTGPKISVVMAVYNGGDYLAESIESILQQSFCDFELIVVDDGSTDRTAEIIHSYARADRRVVAVYQQNKGQTRALNYGIRLARGKYIARQDADDVSLPIRLERQHAFLEANPEYFLLGGQWSFMDDQGEPLPSHLTQWCQGSSTLKRVLSFYNPFCHSAACFRNDIEKIKGYYREDFRFAQDYELWTRIAKSYKVENLDEMLVKVRLQQNRVSVQHQRRQRYFAMRTKLTLTPFSGYSSGFLYHLAKDVGVISLPMGLIHRVRRYMNRANKV